jgi:MraZ protein
MILDDKDPDVARFLRLVYGEAMGIVLDSSDRVTLPKYFMELAGITKDVVLTTAGNKLELWDATYYQQYFTANVSSLSDLSKKMSSGIYNKKSSV